MAYVKSITDSEGVTTIAGDYHANCTTLGTFGEDEVSLVICNASAMERLRKEGVLIAENDLDLLVKRPEIAREVFKVALATGEYLTIKEWEMVGKPLSSSPIVPVTYL